MKLTATQSVITTESWHPDFMSAIYADKELHSKYPIASEIATKDQFETLSTLFNNFYNYHVPKEVLSKRF
jgi:hypothetical protein